jgi:bifunctional DNase/RNase
MIEVTVESVRVSLMSQHRVVVLKDKESPRYLPIWIGPFEAEAITIELQGVRVPRPMTHDLLRNVIVQLGARISQVAVTDLKDDTFYACVFLEVNGDQMTVDSRPSDAIALAVRAGASILVADEVMEQAGLEPEPGIDLEGEEEKLAPYRDFVESLDVNLPDDEESEE